MEDEDEEELYFTVNESKSSCVSRTESTVAIPGPEGSCT
jgi:hypothetical protein